MRTISTEGYPCAGSVTAGSAPRLQWIPIGDLIVDPSYQRPIGDNGRACITQIARSFQWSYFTAVVVAALDDGKFAIIDGQRRATAAALAGFDKVPCQIVEADQQQQAMARAIINGAVRSNSRMAVHKAEPHHQRALRGPLGRTLRPSGCRTVAISRSDRPAKRWTDDGDRRARALPGAVWRRNAHHRAAMRDSDN